MEGMCAWAQPNRRMLGTILPVPFCALVLRRNSPTQRLRVACPVLQHVPGLPSSAECVPGDAFSIGCDSRCGWSQEGKVDGGEGVIYLQA